MDFSHLLEGFLLFCIIAGVVALYIDTRRDNQKKSKRL